MKLCDECGVWRPENAREPRSTIWHLPYCTTQEHPMRDPMNMHPNDNAPHEHAYTPPAEPADTIDPPASTPDPFMVAMLGAIQALLPMIAEGKADEKKRARMNAFRSYALGLMVAGKSWDEAKSLALDILSQEDAAATATP